MKNFLFTLTVVAVFSFANQVSAQFPDSLEPARVLRPIPREYDDEHRLFQGIPSMTLTQNGRAWAAWYAGGDKEGDENYVLVATSGAGCSTWTKPLFAIDVAGPVRVYDPAMWTDSTGKVWLFWAQSEHHWDGRGGVWCMTTDDPDSESTTWSEPRRLCDGIMMCKPIIDSQGRRLLPVAIWNREPVHPDTTIPIGANVIVSNDAGINWTPLGHTVIPKALANCDEHMIIERKDGSFLMFIRTNYGIAESVSTDDGKSWSEPKPSDVAHTTSRFFIRRLHSGNLLLVKHGAIHERAGRSHLTAYLSADDGKTWKGSLLLDERTGVSYPDGDETKDGMIFVIYDYNRTADKEVLVARFTEADILSGKIVSDGGALRLRVNKSTALLAPQGLTHSKSNSINSLLNTTN